MTSPKAMQDAFYYGDEQKTKNPAEAGFFYKETKII
jgi:hypothetical protein